MAAIRSGADGTRRGVGLDRRVRGTSARRGSATPQRSRCSRHRRQPSARTGRQHLPVLRRGRLGYHLRRLTLTGQQLQRSSGTHHLQPVRLLWTGWPDCHRRSGESVDGAGVAGPASPVRREHLRVVATLAALGPDGDAWRDGRADRLCSPFPLLGLAQRLHLGRAGRA